MLGRRCPDFLVLGPGVPRFSLGVSQWSLSRPRISGLVRDRASNHSPDASGKQSERARRRKLKFFDSDSLLLYVNGWGSACPQFLDTVFYRPKFVEEIVMREYSKERQAGKTLNREGEILLGGDFGSHEK